MLSIPSKLNLSGESIFSTIAKLSNQHNAINLGQGFPDFAIDPTLKKLVQEAAHGGNHQYAPMQGKLVLRQAIAKKFEKTFGLNLDPEEEITITAGATQALFCSIQALVQKDDEVIVIEPGYDSYIPSILLAGGIPISCPMTKTFKIDWDLISQCISSKTSLIIINSPHNPTGQILEAKDIQLLRELTRNTNIKILSDEVYQHLIYDKKQHLSLFADEELRTRTICTYSFGKTFHTTGWKLGYALALPPLTKALRSVHQWNVFSVNSFIQIALAEYLNNPSHYLNLPQFYQKKRDLFAEGMKQSRFKAIKCHGTYFQLYDYSALSDEPDILFAERLIKEHKVASIPISPFYSKDPNQKILRFCFAKKETTLQKALKVLQSIH